LIIYSITKTLTFIQAIISLNIFTHHSLLTIILKIAYNQRIEYLIKNENMDSTTVNISHDKTMKYHFNLKNALDVFDLNQLLQQIVSTRSSSNTLELPPIHIEVMNYDYYHQDAPIYPKLQNIKECGRKWNVSMLLISVEDEINRNS